MMIKKNYLKKIKGNIFSSPITIFLGLHNNTQTSTNIRFFY